MRKIKNKKAQEFSIATLLLLVLGVIVLVIIILGFWKGWDWIFGKIPFLPGGDLATFKQGCNLAAKMDSSEDYCQEYKPVKLPGSSEAVYINCEYVQGSLEKTLDCGETDYALEFCKNLKKDAKFMVGRVEKECVKSGEDWIWEQG